MILIHEENQLLEFDSSINEFVDLYIKSFPDDNEREDFGLISERIRNNSFQDDPKTFIVLMSGGGMICEYYYSCNSILITYIAVDAEFQRKGVGSKLLTSGVDLVREAINTNLQRQVNAIFFEANNPIETESDYMSPWDRLAFFSKIGAKYIDIPYVQPSLGEGKERVRNLFLCCFPIDEGADYLHKKVISDFLHSFYKELGVMYPELDTDMQDMQMKLDQDSIGEAYLLREIPYLEQAQFFYKDCAVAFHLICEEKILPDYNCPFFSSFERDLFAGIYQQKKKRPYQSYCLSAYLPDEIEIQFPEKINYTSEGRFETIYTDVNRRSLNVKVYTVVTLIDPKEDSSNLDSIFSFIVQPVDRFSEFDLIKLSALFGSNQESTHLRREVKFGNKEHDFFQFSEQLALLKINQINSVDQLSNLSFKRDTVSYSIQIVANESFGIPSHSFIKTIDNATRGDIEANNEIKAYYDENGDKDAQYFANFMCGLTLGIFDFNRMGYDEFSDTIAPVISSPSGFILLNRSVLLSFSNDDPVFFSSKNTIGISPYVIVPNVVLTYNESLLSESHDLLTDVIQYQKSNKVTESQLESVEKNLTYEIPNIFNYPTEKTILSKGNELRKLDDYRNEITSLKTDVNSRIERIYAEKRRKAELIITLILLIISLIQIDPFIMKVSNGLASYFPIASKGNQFLEIGIYLSILLLIVIWFVYFSRRALKR